MYRVYAMDWIANTENFLLECDTLEDAIEYALTEDAADTLIYDNDHDSPRWTSF